MNLNIDKVLIFFFCILSINSCKNNTETEREKSKNTVPIVVKKNSSVNRSKNDQNYKRSKNFVVFDNDTLYVEDEGKVLNVNKLNSEIYYYNLFVSAQPETGLGKNFLKVKNKNDDLLWQKEFNNKIIISDNFNSIIFIDVESNSVEYYNGKNGKKSKNYVISKKYILGDANDYVASINGVFIKLVNSDDYSFEDILFLNASTGNEKQLKLSEYKGRYLNLIKIENKISLLEKKNVIIDNIE